MIVVILTSIVSYVRIKNTLLDEANEDIKASLDGYIHMLDAMPDIDYDSSAKDYGVYSRTRITVIDANTGEVLGDSHNDITTMDNHLYRTEVSDAIRLGEGTSQRHSKTEQVDFIYYAHYAEIDGIPLVVRSSVPLYTIKGTYTSILTTMLLAFLISTLIAFFISYRYNNKVIKPINDITSFARSISKGDYGRSIHINSYDEVTQLSVALNKLSKSLRKSFRSISMKNAQLEAILHSLRQGIMVCDKKGNVLYTNESFMNIIKADYELVDKNIYHNLFDENIYDLLDEIKNNAENDIITKENVQFSDGTYRNYSGCFIKDEKNKKKGILLVVEDVTSIRKLERMRSVFVSNVTHELKTPITCISGYAQTLLNGAIHDKENVHKFLRIIDDESQRLNLLIDDILTLSGLERQTQSVFKDRIDLVEIASEVVELIKQKYPDKNDVEYIIDADKDNEYAIYGDGHKLKQIMINLVDNSAKHTHNGHIKISFESNESKTVMRVADTGIGISKKYHDRIFERFYRVDKHRSRETGGTGLGLSIVKHLVKLHGGEIELYSEEGVGTSISIEFPNKFVGS